MHDHNRLVNVFVYNPKAVSKHAYIIDVTVAYTEPETGQVDILLINHAIKMKGLNHHLLCPMQYCMNGVLIHEIPKLLSSIPSETMHAIHLKNPFDITHPIIIPLKFNGLTSYFEIRTPTHEEYEDHNISR